jgi:hypothetical protein
VKNNLMAANAVDVEIRKYLSMLDADGKKSMLEVIKGFINATHKQTNILGSNNFSIDYTRYRYPVSAIKFNRDEINER